MPKIVETVKVKMIVELEWDEANLGKKWMNPDNIRALLYSKAYTKKELLSVKVIQDHSLVEACNLLRAVDKSLQEILNLGATLDDVIGDMDDFLTYQDFEDGVTLKLKQDYNRRLAESFRCCGWCGGHVFSTITYLDGEPQLPVTVIDHHIACPFKE